MAIALGLTILSLIIWLLLLLGWGQFWRCDQRLEGEREKQLELNTQSLEYSLRERCALAKPVQRTYKTIPSPSVCAVIPARNEADVLPISLRSLLTQSYPGSLTVILVDDQSTDGTAQVAKQTAEELGKLEKLNILSGAPLPGGWSGKLWAMQQGVEKAQTFSPDYILLTDADIEHDADNLGRLVLKASQQDLDMASVMVRLRCESFWEKFLIPAFVFFFQMLYPFPWVNDPTKKMAGAAGGCILIRREALERIGGIESIRHALIDDCALAQKVKELRVTGHGSENEESKSSFARRLNFFGRSQEFRTQNTLREGQSPTKLGTQNSPFSGKIWLGLSDRTVSLRPYPDLQTIWTMVARTAYTQLNYNPLLLVGTLVGMTLVYLLPPVSFVVGGMTDHWPIALTGLAAYLLMTLAYFPTVRFYKCSPVYTFCLPAIAFLYALMTLDSALRHWQGRGGAWKGRVYPGNGNNA